jgi:hypothetical protein
MASVDHLKKTRIFDEHVAAGKHPDWGTSQKPQMRHFTLLLGANLSA